MRLVRRKLRQCQLLFFTLDVRLYTKKYISIVEVVALFVGSTSVQPFFSILKIYFLLNQRRRKNIIESVTKLQIVREFWLFFIVLFDLFNFYHDLFFKIVVQSEPNRNVRAREEKKNVYREIGTFDDFEKEKK